jgi:tRNA nucleotidyltransferase (CCA-adding enzyme)
MERLLKQIIKQIKPSEKKVIPEINRTIKKINDELKKQKINAECTPGGSIAKNTFLKGDHDCDLFVRFEMEYAKQDISKILGKVLKKIFPKIVLVHGSRDYFHLKNKFTYEVVPVLKIEHPSGAENVMDISPLHVYWVRQFPKYTDQIRLTKAFCKAIGVYGAESYIRGFSGHVIDIMTVYYKSFVKLLKASQKWRPDEVIDFYDAHSGRAYQVLNKSKLASPIIVIDPIQPERNAAAALGKEKYDIFRQKAKEFLEKPSKKFFERKELTLQEIMKKAKNKKLVLVNVTSLKGKEDIVGAKLLKSFNYMKKQLTLNDFKVYDTGWKWDKVKDALFYYIVDKELLSPSFIRMGPPLKNKKHSTIFKKAHPKTYEEKGRLYARIKRPFRTPESLVQALSKENYIKAKTRKVVVLKK